MKEMDDLNIIISVLLVAVLLLTPITASMFLFIASGVPAEVSETKLSSTETTYDISKASHSNLFVNKLIPKTGSSISIVPSGGEDNIVTSGGFESGSGWLAGDWSIESGIATIDQSGLGEDETFTLRQDVGAEGGHDYMVTFTITDYVSGEIVVEIGNAQGTTRAEEDEFSETITSTGTGKLKFIASAAEGEDTVELSIDDVSVYDITESDKLLVVSNVVITSDGRVGIGIENPEASLHIAGGSAYVGYLKITRDHRPQIFFNHEGGQDDANGRIMLHNGTLNFIQSDDSNNFLNNRMAINLTSGKVGIGIENPEAKLHVDGNLGGPAQRPSISLDSNDWFTMGHDSGYGYIGWFTKGDGEKFINTHYKEYIQVKAKAIIGVWNGIAFKTAPEYTSLGGPSNMETRLFIGDDGHVTINDLAGSGNAYVCVDGDGKLFRSATACV